MPIKQWLLDAVDGTTATQANTGASSYTHGSGNTAVLSAAAADRGTTGLDITLGGTSGEVFQFSSDNSNALWAGSIVFTMPLTNPSADAQYLTVRDGTGTRSISVWVTASGGLQIGDFANTRSTILSAAQGAAVYGVQVRLEVVLNTSSQVSTASLYNSATGAKLGSTASIANVGTTKLQTWQLVSTTQAGRYRVDSIQANDGGSSEIGPLVVTLSVPTLSYTPGANRVANGTISSADINRIDAAVKSVSDAVDTIAAYLKSVS
jgi:hypothetical protein